jgi:hypothetical protein
MVNEMIVTKVSIPAILIVLFFENVKNIRIDNKVANK